MVKAKPSSFFPQLLRANLLILVIPLVISLLLAQLSVTILENEARKTSLATLEQTSKIIDTRFQELDSLVRQIALDPEIKSFLGLRNFEETTRSYFDVWALTRKLPNYPLINSFIEKLYLYSTALGVAVSYEEALFDGPQDFARVFQYGSWTYPKWQDFFLKTGHQKRLVTQAQLKVDNRVLKGLYYLQSLPLEFRQSAPLGQIVFFINDETIKSYLNSLEVGEKGIVLVADAQGEVVSTITRSWSPQRQATLAQALRQSTRLVEEPGFIVSQTKSLATGWSYVSVLPQDVVLAPVLLVRNLVIAAIILTALLSLSLAWWVSRRSAQPIESVVKGLQETLGLQLPVMQADLLRQLFSGTLVDPVDIEARAQAAGLPLQATSFAAAVVQIEGYVDPLPTKTLAEVNLAKAWVRERLDCLPTLRVFAQDDDLHTLNLLFLSSLPTGELADPARAFLEALARDLPQELHTSMVWSLGGVVPLVGEIASSHREAREPLLSAGHQGRFWYPLETEIRLLALVKKGDRSGVARALEQIRRENLVDRTLSPTVFSNLASAMYSSMVRGLTQTLESDISHEDAQQWFSWFHQQLLQTCSTISDQKKQGAEGKLVEIDLYLEQNLTDPGLTLFSVAQQFSMTEAFLYHFYRNHAGLSFADSLEKIRIERACRLLVEEQMKISQVIPKTGFTSPSTFRRAFRRVMGVSPSDYHPT